LDQIGLAYDFTVLKWHLREILASFDHVCLNDVPPFDRINPSSENIATTIYEEFPEKGSSSSQASRSANLQTPALPTCRVNRFRSWTLIPR